MIVLTMSLRPSYFVAAEHSTLTTIAMRHDHGYMLGTGGGVCMLGRLVAKSDGAIVVYTFALDSCEG